jgi:hypothetical protein
MSAVAENPTALNSATTKRVSIFDSPYVFWVTLGLYLAAHVALRLWETPNIGKNDVQEAVAAQAWAWGYHPRNPPLHTWLLMGSYALFGVNLIAHVVLKYALVGGCYVFAFLSGKRVLSTPTMAALSALSLTLLAPFAWTVHTALTHTLLLAVACLGVLWAAIRLSERRTLLNYVVFGVLIGFGFLAKYSFILFFAPLVLAMLTQRALRATLADWRMLVSVAVAAVLFAPHAVWMLGPRFDFIAFLVEKQGAEAPASYLQDVLAGLGALGVGAISYAGLLLLMLALSWRAAGAAASPPAPWARAIPLISVFAFGILILDVFVLRATQFEERYFTFALLTAPLAVFLWFDRREGASSMTARWAWGLLIVAMLGFGALSGRALLQHRTCNRCWEEMATPALVDGLASHGFRGGTLVADHYNLAGNLRLAFPESRVYAANYVVHQPSLGGAGQCVLVWNARNAGDAMPAMLEEFLAARGLPAPDGAPRFVEAPLRRSSARIDRFAYWPLRGVNGDCRAS